jgi:acyl-CoA dehydrogenase
MFITSGMRADVITVAVRTGGPGLGGVSLLVVDGDTPGLTRTPLKKMGWWCSDTAALYFDECRVPVANLLGEENHGFLGIMQNFNRERLMLAAMAVAFSQVCYDDALAWARERETFGKPLLTRQVIRHKLVDMLTRIEPVRCWLYDMARRVDAGEWPIAGCACSRTPPPRASSTAPARACRSSAAPATCAAPGSSGSSARPRCWRSAAAPKRS